MESGSTSGIRTICDVLSVATKPAAVCTDGARIHIPFINYLILFTSKCWGYAVSGSWSGLSIPKFVSARPTHGGRYEFLLKESTYTGTLDRGLSINRVPLPGDLNLYLPKRNNFRRIERSTLTTGVVSPRLHRRWN